MRDLLPTFKSCCPQIALISADWHCVTQHCPHASQMWVVTWPGGRGCGAAGEPCWHNKYQTSVICTRAQNDCSTAAVCWCCVDAALLVLRRLCCCEREALSAA